MGAGWSYAMNVPLLFADQPVKPGSIGGSGIYNGRSDPIKILIKEHLDTRILIANVPKPGARRPIQNAFDFNFDYFLPDKNFENSAFIFDSAIPFYQSRSLAVSQLSSHDTFTHTDKNFTCSVQVSWTMQSNFHSFRSTYEFLSYSGLRTFSMASINNHVEACGLTLCNRYDNGAFRTPPHFQDSASVTITSINIFSISTTATMATVIPSTLDKNLHPLNVEYFTFNTRLVAFNGTERLAVNMNLIKPVSGLVTFGLYKLPEIIKPPLDMKSWL